MMELLVKYGAELLENAVVEALEHGYSRIGDVKTILDKRLHATDPKATPIDLHLDPKLAGKTVKPHALKAYSALVSGGEK
jgi:hypothetical protein